MVAQPASHLCAHTISSRYLCNQARFHAMFQRVLWQCLSVILTEGQRDRNANFTFNVYWNWISTLISGTPLHHLFCYLSDSCALWDIVHRCAALSENSSQEMDSQFPFKRTISIKLFQKINQPNKSLPPPQQGDRVISSPSSLMSCPSSDDRRTVELSLERSCSHNVHFQSSLVLLLLLGLTEETESDLALEVQCQAVCTTPGRSSVPNRRTKFEVKEINAKKGKQQVSWTVGWERHRQKREEMRPETLSTGYKLKRWYPSLPCENSVLVILGGQILLSAVHLSCSFKSDSAKD